LPSDILESIKHPYITMARVSDDYPTPTNWNIGTNSMLTWALDLAPNKDNFWSTSVQPGNYYKRIEPRPEIPLITALLSMGPVGISDKIGYTNDTLIKRSMNSNGLLLKPSKPITSIDAMFDVNVNNKVNGYVWETFSEVNNMYWFYVLGINVVNYKLKNKDFWPIAVIDPKSEIKFAWAKFDEDYIITCRNGTRTSNCVTLINSESDLPNLNTGIGPNNETRAYGYWRFFSINGKSGWGLLGELNKYVSVSPLRFTNITYDPNGIKASVKGAPLELVSIWAISPDNGGSILQKDVTLDAKGTANVVFGY